MAYSREDYEGDVEAEAEPEFTTPPRWAQAPTFVILAIILFAFVWHFPGGMIDWAISGPRLLEGRYETIALHMFAHGGLLHIGMNSYVLFILGPIMTQQMGSPPMAWLRFVIFYLVAGLAGAACYLAINPNQEVPMLGASGAISGLIGLIARLRGEGEGFVPIFSKEMGLRVWDFAKANLILIALITLPILLSDGSGGVAWEAHLGGFVVGLLAAPALLAFEKG